MEVLEMLESMSTFAMIVEFSFSKDNEFIPIVCIYCVSEYILNDHLCGCWS